VLGSKHTDQRELRPSSRWTRSPALASWAVLQETELTSEVGRSCSSARWARAQTFGV